MPGVFTWTRCVLFMVSFALVFGCGASGDNHLCRRYEAGNHVEVSAGEVLLSWEQGVGNPLHAHAASLTHELVYNGIDSAAVVINHNAYGPGYERPVSYGNQRYDMAKSRDITIRDVTIRVEYADQRRIVFTVIQDAHQ